MATSNAQLSSKLAAQGAQMTPLAIKDELKVWKDKNMHVMSQLLGDKDRAEKLYIATAYAISQVPALATCSKASLINCMMQSCYTGLFPGSLQECDYVPYGKVATFIPRYGGLVGLAEQTGMYSGFSANVVYDGDDFDFQEGSEPFLKHRKFLGPQKERGERVAVYASCRSNSGTPIFIVMTMDEVYSIKNRSKASGSSFSPWSNNQEFDFDEMCKKTALKRLTKLLKKSPQLARAVEIDNAAEAPDLAKPTVPGLSGFDDASGERGADATAEAVPTAKNVPNSPVSQAEAELAAQEAPLEPEVESHMRTIAPPPEDAKATMDRMKERAAKEASAAKAK